MLLEISITFSSTRDNKPLTGAWSSRPWSWTAAGKTGETSSWERRSAAWKAREAAGGEWRCSTREAWKTTSGEWWWARWKASSRQRREASRRRWERTGREGWDANWGCTRDLTLDDWSGEGTKAC